MFGISLLERLLRGLVEAKVPVASVEVALAEGDEAPRLNADMDGALPLRWTRGSETLAKRLAGALARASGDAVLALSADAVVDTRMLAHLATASGSLAFQAGDEGGAAAALRLEPGAGPLPDDAGDLAALAEALVTAAP